MSGLALWLHSRGVKVTGSDMAHSSRSDRVERAGIPVFYGHDPRHVNGVDMVVYNTDVHAENPERHAALLQGIPLVHRSEVLAQALDAYRAITVSGTHGKTTTTTMVGTVLAHCGMDPTVFVGGEVGQFQGNLRVGHGPWAVAEADESDGSFLRYSPEIAVATNVEPEHLEHYENRFDRLVEGFRQYLSKVPPHGLAVLGVGNSTLAQLGQEMSAPTKTYGLVEGADVQARDIILGRQGSVFSVYEHDVLLGRAQLKIPGHHNIENGLAALIVAQHLGAPIGVAIEALSDFQNANRRFQYHLSGEIQVVDDYAHHPTEIRATLAACRQVTAGRVLAVFQPQRYTRTRDLWTGFVEAFHQADMVYLTDVYAPPGDVPLPGISGATLAQAIAQNMGSDRVSYMDDKLDAVTQIVNIARPGDTIITMGAGDIFRVAEEIAQTLGLS